jgi:hypothetical protein
MTEVSPKRMTLDEARTSVDDLITCPQESLIDVVRRHGLHGTRTMLGTLHQLTRIEYAQKVLSAEQVAERSRIIQETKKGMRVRALELMEGHLYRWGGERGDVKNVYFVDRNNIESESVTKHEIEEMILAAQLSMSTLSQGGIDLAVFAKMESRLVEYREILQEFDLSSRRALSKVREQLANGERLVVRGRPPKNRARGR